MLQAARCAQGLLGGSAGLVRQFLLGQQNPDGAFQDRAGHSDLYYTVFGLDALAALAPEDATSAASHEPPLSRSSTTLSPLCGERAGREKLSGQVLVAARFVQSLGEGQDLDFVHLCCLARALGQTSSSPAPRPDATVTAENLLRRIESFRSRDGGYNTSSGSPAGTVYGCFLALGAYQDLDRQPPNSEGLVQCLDGLATLDGAWSNATAGSFRSELRTSTGSTNATAAAMAVLRALRRPVPLAAAHWLLARLHRQGGFLAAPDSPLPDLLSTATALHALAGMPVPLQDFRESCLDFVDSLWTNEGSFHAHWAEETLDAEYTFYGLLALGHLAVR
jgi:prenyltransferase beta subunit